MPIDVSMTDIFENQYELVQLTNQNRKFRNINTGLFLCIIILTAVAIYFKISQSQVNTLKNRERL